MLMRHLFTILLTAALLALPIFYVACVSDSRAAAEAAAHAAVASQRYERAVEIIKKYETLHQPRHWPLVGYGHKVLPGEKYSRKKALTEKEADALLRKDLSKLCAYFRSYGQDSLLLATLAYNIGPGAVSRSSIIRKLKCGDRNIRDIYISHCRYRGKVHAKIRQRRIEEFEALYIKKEITIISRPPARKQTIAFNYEA